MASLFTRALAGVGKEAAGIASKYIDESLAQSRAQMLADLQVQTAGRMRAEEDAFKNDPTRVARDRQNQVDNIKAIGGAQNLVALEGERAKATDTELQAALTKNEVDRKTASTQAETDLLIKRMNDPAYVAGLRKQAQATHIESAGSVAQAALARAQLDQIKTIGDLKSQLQQAVATGDKASEQSLREQLGVWTDKAGKVEKARESVIAAQKAMIGPQKILGDSMASPEAKAEAEQQLRELRAVANAAAKEAGIELPGAPAREIPQGAIDMLKGNPALAKDFDAKYGQGASQQYLNSGGSPGKPAKAPAPAAAPAPAWQPDPASPVGRQRALMDQAREQQQAQEAAAQQAAATKAQELLSGGASRAKLYRFMSTPEFRRVDTDTQKRISAIVNGR
ncbi:MAG: hypothetical protein IIZ92_19670 [Aquincola sp.]|nr:hypothetical protein [Aquincola sp.]